VVIFEKNFLILALLGRFRWLPIEEINIFLRIMALLGRFRCLLLRGANAKKYEFFRVMLIFLTISLTTN
jgi:hypothetical protein